MCRVPYIMACLVGLPPLWHMGDAICDDLPCRHRHSWGTKELSAKGKDLKSNICLYSLHASYNDAEN